MYNTSIYEITLRLTVKILTFQGIKCENTYETDACITDECRGLEQGRVAVWFGSMSVT